MLELVDEPTLLAALRRDAPIENLLDWLHRFDPRWSDATTLRLYHELVQRDDWQTMQTDQACELALNTVRVTLHPHRIYLTTAPK